MLIYLTQFGMNRKRRNTKEKRIKVVYSKINFALRKQ